MATVTLRARTTREATTSTTKECRKPHDCNGLRYNESGPAGWWNTTAEPDPLIWY